MSEIANEVDNDSDFVKFILHEGSGKTLRRKEVEFKQHKAVTGGSFAAVTAVTPVTTRPKAVASTPNAIKGAGVVGTSTAAASAMASSLRQQQTAAMKPKASPAVPAQQKFIPSTAATAATPPSGADSQYKTSSMLLPDDSPGAATPSTPTSAPVAANSPYVSIPIPPVPNGNSSRAVENPAAIDSSKTSESALLATPQFGRMFGVPLEVLMEAERVQVNVENVDAPAFVIKCIEAVDKFGLDKEGIYSIQGSSQEIEHIQSMFENQNPLFVDISDPAAYHNDVYAIGTSLKLYFKALPDSLCTDIAYDKFFEASKIADDNLRRDNMHYLVNELPDANYTTLRYLILHLSRVQDNFRANKMTIRNLANEWGTLLMGGEAKDAEAHAVVIGTILTNCYSIFAS